MQRRAFTAGHSAVFRETAVAMPSPEFNQRRNGGMITAKRYKVGLPGRGPLPVRCPILLVWTATHACHGVYACSLSRKWLRVL